MLAAGVIGTATVSELPPPPRVDAVAPASVITDTLYSLGTMATVGWNIAALPVNAVISAPFDIGTALAVAAQRPDLSPSVLSYLVHYYLDPSANDNVYGYAWTFDNAVLEPLVALLPGASATAARDAIGRVVQSIHDGLAAGLPDQQAGATAVNTLQYVDPAGRIASAAMWAARIPLQLTSTVFNYAVKLPAVIEATAEAALRDPSQIPGLVSNLVYGLLDPGTPELYRNGGVLGSVLFAISYPFTLLPGPIGDAGGQGWATTVYRDVAAQIRGLLAGLPAPITPTPFGSDVAAPSVSGSMAIARQEGPAALPAASRADAAAPQPTSGKSVTDATEVAEVAEPVSATAEAVPAIVDPRKTDTSTTGAAKTSDAGAATPAPATRVPATNRDVRRVPHGSGRPGTATTAGSGDSSPSKSAGTPRSAGTSRSAGSAPD
jgi:hypothetical protein